MLTIWNNTIQSLIISNDASAIRLAFLLVNEPRDIYRWWVVSLCNSSEEDINALSLFYIPRICINHILSEHMQYYITHQWEYNSGAWASLRNSFRENFNSCTYAVQ